MAFITMGFQFVTYPLRLFTISFKIFRTIRYYFLVAIGIRCCNPTLFESIKDITYEKYVRNIAGSYYSRQVAEYFSLVTFVALGSLCRFTWNNWYYPSYSYDLTANQYKRLLIQMAVLFVMEFCSDMFNRVCMRLVSGVWIVELGQEQTIGHKKTRFLFTLFILHYLHDVYYATQVIMPTTIAS